MEFDSLFTAVQGIMRSHQSTTIIPFSKVNKENDIVSKHITESLGCLVSELGLKDEHKRKINLFLIVNTNFPSISTLENDSNFWHLLGCLPNMSPYLFLEIVSNLNFQSYIGEALRLCPEYLSFEIFEEINNHLKILNPEVAVPLLHSVYESIFFKIVRLQKENRPSIIIKKFVNIFKEAVSFDIKELIDQLDLKEGKRNIYLGYYLQMLLLLLKNCILSTKGSHVEKIDVYDFNVDFDYDKWGECTGELNWINHSLGLLVVKCSDRVMAISVDMYLSWCEEDIKGCIDKTLQTAVREAAYCCREELRSILHLSDNVCSLKQLESSLNNIALQPLTEDDEIKKADAETIVMNLLNPKKTQTKWLKGLIQLPDIFQSSTYMRVILHSSHFFDLEVAQVLLDCLLNFLSTSSCPGEFSEDAKNLFFNCIKKQPLQIQLDLLDYYLKKRNSSNLLQREKFNEVLTTTLNKVSTANENKTEMISEVVILSFENCDTLVKTLLQECLSSELKADLLLDLLSHVTPLANAECGQTSLGLTLGSTVHLMDTVVTSLEKKKDHFIQLVKKLGALGIVETNTFFPDYVLPRFEEQINENDVQNIIFYSDLVKVYVEQPSLPKNAATLLAYLAELLENMRPNINNFSLDKMTVTTHLVGVTRELAEAFVKNKTAEDDAILWLRTRFEDLKGIHRLHIAVLWTHFGIEAPNLPHWAMSSLGLGDDLLDISSTARRERVTSVVKVLPVLTIYEWYLIGSLNTTNDKLILPTVEAIIDAILVSIKVPFFLRNLHITNNVIINFTEFMWRLVLPKVKPLDEKRKKQLSQRLTHLLEVLPEELKQSQSHQIRLIINSINTTTH